MTELKRVLLNGDAGAYVEIACASTDTKPTTGIAEGSIAIEIDTGDVYMFNGSTWTKQFSLQGS
jgi:hypothetical protein